MIAAAASIAGCGAANEAAEVKATPNPAAVISLPDLSRGPWGEHRSGRFHLRVPLPDASGWSVDDERTPWIEAKHRGAQAQLIVRIWREDDITNRARCEANARVTRVLPDREGAEIVEERAVRAPRGFDTVATVGVVPGGRGLPLVGFVMAFGASVRRCFAYVLVTKADGKDAEELIAERLATMVELSLSNVALEDDREPSIPKEPVPQSGRASPLDPQR